MRTAILRAVIAFVLYVFTFSSVYAADAPAKQKPAKTPELVEKGKLTYYKRCSFCHGLTGDGDGPAAAQMIPRPRDFTLGLYKFRSTETGGLPTDEDLFRTISRGIPGTAMQTFDSDKIKNGLTEEERWQVIYYIQTFSESFADKDMDPYSMVVKVSAEIKSSPESIAKGEKIFKEMKCWECHGDGGRGNGPNSPKLKDKFRGDKILPFDLTKGWRYKAGNTSLDIYRRFSTGINGTPMPSFADSLNDEERWHLANFVVSLQKKELNAGSVLKVRQAGGDLPSSPDDPAWSKAEGIDVQMAGQVIARPRWENPSVDVVTVRALYNDKEIAFLLEFGDRFKDVVHAPELEYAVPASYAGYVKGGDVPRQPGNFRDSVAIQFPVKPFDGTRKPYFFRGASSNPVNLWVWKSDLEEAGQPAVEDSNASGFRQGIRIQPPEDQQVMGKGVWKDGVWRVVMKRPLRSEGKNDVQFEKGKFMPFSLNAWDGSNGENGLIMSLSTWNYIVMEAPVPVTVYLYILLGIILAGGIEWWLVKKVKSREQA
ncbi:MAG: c-type cytochrome [Deltaproteobacteria bacterium]|nr:c-type cytochrome [Deltaproteobacteria bacterium]